jgi:predicted MFS family arabinose efflux permease
MWVPNGLIVGCEALFIPYSTRWSGLLLSASALGMLCGDLLVGRFLRPDARRRMISPLRLLLATPYLLFAVAMPIGAAAVLVGIASIGYGSTLLLQEQLLARTPHELSGHALGLQSSGMLTMQAVGAAMAGALANHLPTGAVMTCLAVASTLVTLSLTAGLRAGDAPHPTVRSAGRRLSAAVAASRSRRSGTRTAR